MFTKNQINKASNYSYHTRILIKILPAYRACLLLFEPLVGARLAHEVLPFTIQPHHSRADHQLIVADLTLLTRERLVRREMLESCDPLPAKTFGEDAVVSGPESLV